MKFASFLVLGILATTNLFIWYAVFAAERGVLTVAFLDVGHARTLTLPLTMFMREARWQS